MGRSYNDVAKGKARKMFREFIRRELLYLKRPKDVKVVCLPGAEREGEEALEVKEVYDALGIPRENVVGLEYDSEKAKRLRDAGLGIEVVCGDAYNFFRETDKKFDVVSLDYTGPFDERKGLTLETIASRHILDSQGILQTIFFGKRESADLQEFMRLRYSRIKSLSDSTLQGRPEQPAYDGTMGTYDILPFSSEVREDGLTMELVTIFGSGTLNFPFGRHLFYDSPEFQKSLDGIVSEAKSKGLAPSMIDEDLKAELSKDLYLIARNQFISHARKSLGLDPKQATILLNVLNADVVKPYIARAHERYSYISNTASPMLVDLFAFFPVRHSLIQRATMALRTEVDEVTGKVRFKERFSSLRGDYRRKMKDLLEEAEKDCYFTMIPRVFLGSSALPVLTKRIAIEEFRAGKTVDEVREKYRGGESKPLAQWKAHVTMGTYDESTPQSEESLDATIVQEGNGEVEKITKEEAIELLREGIPAEEIHLAYPTSFTRGQLRAFKAHYVTMGKKI